MNVAKKYNINDVITNGFGKDLYKHDLEGVTEIANRCMPLILDIVAGFSKDSFMHDELVNYAYVATIAGIIEYESRMGEFGDYLSSYIVESLEETTKIKRSSLPLSVAAKQLVCNNGTCNGINASCLEKNCLNRKTIEASEKKQMLNRARNILANLDENEKDVITPIINGEVDNVKQFTKKQNRVLSNIKKQF